MNKLHIAEYYMTLHSSPKIDEEERRLLDRLDEDSTVRKLFAGLSSSLDFLPETPSITKQKFLTRQNKRISSSATKLLGLPSIDMSEAPREDLGGQSSSSYERVSKKPLYCSKSMPNLSLAEKKTDNNLFEMLEKEKKLSQVVKRIVLSNKQESFAKIIAELFLKRMQLEEEDAKIFELQIIRNTPLQFSLFYLERCTSPTYFRPNLACTVDEFLSVLVREIKRSLEITDKYEREAFADVCKKIPIGLKGHLIPILLNNLSDEDLIYLAKLLFDIKEKETEISKFFNQFQREWIKKALNHSRLIDVLQKVNFKELKEWNSWKKDSFLPKSCLANVLSKTYLNFKNCNFADGLAMKLFQRLRASSEWNVKEILTDSISDFCKKELPLPMQTVLSTRRVVVEQCIEKEEYPDLVRYFSLHFLFLLIEEQYKKKVNSLLTSGLSKTEKQAFLDFWDNFDRFLKIIGEANVNPDKEQNPMLKGVWQENKELIDKFVEDNSKVNLVAWSPWTPRWIDK